MNTVLLKDKVKPPVPKYVQQLERLVLDTSMFRYEIQEDVFFEFCAKHPELRIEMTKYKELIIMTPTGTETGGNNAELTADIVIWNRKTKKGKAFDSSTGFKMPDGAVRSPDVSWIPLEKWEKIPKAQRKKFAPICPDFVLELKSDTDRLPTLKAKMKEYIANGCRLAWLLDMAKEKAYIFRADGSTQTIKSFDTVLSGEQVLEGFELNLKDLKG